MLRDTILCVDDESDNVEALERLFRKKFNVLKATSGVEALKILDQHPEPIALIISDQRMPNMTGVELLEQSQKKSPDTIRILLTGYTDVESIILAVNQGQIYRYLTKPWDPVDLLNTVEKAVEKYNLRKELAEKNRHLEKALDELKTLDTAKSNFMILINHELKTPLTSILSFGELLKETHLNEEQSLYVNRIGKAADRLKKMVDDVLVIIKAETQQLNAKISSFKYQLDVNDLPSSISSLLHKKLLRVKTDLVEGLIQADPDLLRQVIHRLLHNAAKFADEGSEILVTSQMVQNQIELSVINQGPPLADATRDKILKPFFIDENILNHSTGLGLGLTICQSILKSHGSELHFENGPHSVKVSFFLPTLNKPN